MNALWIVTLVLGIMWLTGFISKYTFGGYLHILLVVALIVVVINLMKGKRVWPG
jgi:hypothetical protein